MKIGALTTKRLENYVEVIMGQLHDIKQRLESLENNYPKKKKEKTDGNEARTEG